MSVEDRRVFGADAVNEVRGLAHGNPERFDRALGTEHVPDRRLSRQIRVDVQFRPTTKRVVHCTYHGRVGTAATSEGPHLRRRVERALQDGLGLSLELWRNRSEVRHQPKRFVVF